MLVLVFMFLLSICLSSLVRTFIPSAAAVLLPGLWCMQVGGVVGCVHGEGHVCVWCVLGWAGGGVCLVVLFTLLDRCFLTLNNSVFLLVGVLD
jgi:hypothetical protein